MTALDRILRRTGRRLRLVRAVRAGGIGLVLGLGVALAVLLVDRGFALGLARSVFPIVAGAGLALGALAGALRPLDRAALARRLDRSYRLADRLGSAHALASGAGGHVDPDFAALVARDADDYAERLDGRGAVPVRFDRAWRLAALLAPLLTAGVLFLPEIGHSRADDAAAAAAETAAIESAERVALAESIEDAADLLDEDIALGGEAPGEQDDADTLAELARQLAADDPSDDVDPLAARDESAARLNELADDAERGAEREARAADELTRRFSGMEPPDAPLSVEELADALRRGELGDAAERLDEILAASRDADSGERRAVADGLRDLGRAAEEIARTTDPALRERREMIEQVLRDEGLDPETLDRLAEGAPPEFRDALDEMRREIADDEFAEEIARDLEDLRREEEALDQAERDAGDIARALEDAADTVEDGAQPPPPPTTDEPTPPQPPSPPGDRAPEQAATPEPEQSQQPQPDDPARKPESQQQQQRSPQDETKPRGQEPGQQDRERTPGQPASEGAPQERPDGQTPSPQSAPQPAPNGETAPTPTPNPDGSETAERTPTPNPDGSETAERTPTPNPDGSETAERTPTPSPNETPQPRGSTPSPESQEQDQQQAQPERDGDPRSERQAAERATPDENAERRPVPGATPPDDPDAAPGRTPPEEVLREIERRRRTAEGRRELAERARETARRLSDRMTDEERRRWAESWAREQQGDGFGPGAGTDSDPDPRTGPGPGPDAGERTFDPLDLAADDPAGDPLAELEGDLADAPPVGPASDRTGPVVRARARRDAERAIEQADIPPRYHRFIRRYFRRLADEPTAPAPPPAGPDP